MGMATALRVRLGAENEMFIVNDADIYIMMQCLSVMKNHDFPLLS